MCILCDETKTPIDFHLLSTCKQKKKWTNLYYWKLFSSFTFFFFSGKLYANPTFNCKRRRSTSTTWNRKLPPTVCFIINQSETIKFDKELATNSNRKEMNKIRTNENKVFYEFTKRRCFARLFIRRQSGFLLVFFLCILLSNRKLYIYWQKPIKMIPFCPFSQWDHFITWSIGEEGGTDEGNGRTIQELLGQSEICH